MTRHAASLFVGLLMAPLAARAQWLPPGQATGTGDVHYNGNVAVRANQPGAPLDVMAGVPARGGYTRILIGGTVPQIELYGSTSSAAIRNDGFTVGFWVNGPSWHDALDIDNGGRIGIGTSSPQYTLDVAGTIHATDVIGVSYGQDVAEWVPASGDVPAGTVVVLNRTKNNEVTSSTRAYDTAVAGVVSAKPGVILGLPSPTKAIIATTGRVRVRVDARKHPIQIGDLLVTSDAKGMAMVSEPVDVAGVKIHRPGTLLGKALEPLAEGTGEILVLLTLQ
jgi:hypothetical protein